MRHRVKYYCHHYNTGAADNFDYWDYQDFDTFGEAERFLNRVTKQIKMCHDYEAKKISFDEFEKWRKSTEIIDVEDGFIIDSTYGTQIMQPRIVKFYPEVEENI